MFNFKINEMCKMLKSTIILIHCMQAKKYFKKILLLKSYDLKLFNDK